MAQNITLLGATYNAVPAVQLPKSGGGTAQFDDTTDANATASDIASGKTAYVNGVKLTGTGSGGGGTDFLITLSYNNVTDMWEPDATFAEIKDAYDDGLNIVVNTTADPFDDCVTADGEYFAEGDPEPCFFYMVHYWDVGGSILYQQEFWLTANGLQAGDGGEFISPFGDFAITSNGDYDIKNYESVSVNVSGGASKNAQTVQSTSRTTSTSLTKVSGEITVAKTGTYDVYWATHRTSTSGTWSSRLYVNSTATGTEQTTFTNHVQTVHLSNISLTQGQKVSVYAKSRGSNYYAYVPMLTIIEA